MKEISRWILIMLAVAAATGVAAAASQEVTFKDPTGDDKGPGTYSYPTDAVYTAGSFDLTGFTMKINGDKADFSVDVNAKLEDPWKMGVGFSVQMVFIFIDQDHKAGSGFINGAPGLNITFAPEDAWEKCIILSPQPASRVHSEIDAKAAEMKDAFLVPNRTRGYNRTITGSVPLKELGEGDPTTWGYQVCMQSNEGFPADNALLIRQVNEYAGQHRFGGGNDGECDPQVMDILAGKGAGAAAEIEEQYKMLQYECNADGTPKKLAVLLMIHPS